MARVTYDIPAVYQQVTLPGNAGTTFICTPQKGTASETKTHTTTLDPFGFGRPVKLKRLVYTVKTAQTGAGNNLTLDVYVGTTSKGSLSLTTETALSVVTSSVFDEVLTATDYIRIYAKSTTTASDANSAIGYLAMQYQDLFLAD